MNPITIKGTVLGEGSPKTIISIMGADAAECLSTVREGKEAGVDCFEWRADFNECRHDSAKMVELGHVLAAELADKPLLFTFRSTSQGGNDEFTAQEYFELTRAIIEAEVTDMVDIETWIGDELVSELCARAHEHGLVVLVSYHDFSGTPDTEWMVGLMNHMLELGADIPKCAVMAHDAAGALRLLSATEEVHRTRQVPLLTMAMGREGSITRLAGEYFGSVLTFCSLAKSSAPGQVDARLARTIMDEIHSVLA